MLVFDRYISRVFMFANTRDMRILTQGGGGRGGGGGVGGGMSDARIERGPWGPRSVAIVLIVGRFASGGTTSFVLFYRLLSR